jgi:hypothetical protein
MPRIAGILCRSLTSRGEPPTLSSHFVKSPSLTSCSTRNVRDRNLDAVTRHERTGAHRTLLLHSTQRTCDQRKPPSEISGLDVFRYTLPCEPSADPPRNLIIHGRRLAGTDRFIRRA